MHDVLKRVHFCGASFDVIDLMIYQWRNKGLHPCASLWQFISIFCISLLNDSELAYSERNLFWYHFNRKSVPQLAYKISEMFILTVNVSEEMKNVQENIKYEYSSFQRVNKVKHQRKKEEKICGCFWYAIMKKSFWHSSTLQKGCCRSL